MTFLSKYRKINWIIKLELNSKQNSKNLRFPERKTCISRRTITLFTYFEVKMAKQPYEEFVFLLIVDWLLYQASKEIHIIKETRLACCLTQIWGYIKHLLVKLWWNLVTNLSTSQENYYFYENKKIVGNCEEQKPKERERQNNSHGSKTFDEQDNIFRKLQWQLKLSNSHYYYFFFTLEYSLNYPKQPFYTNHTG